MTVDVVFGIEFMNLINPLPTEPFEGSIPLWVMLKTDVDSDHIPDSGIRDYCGPEIFISSAVASADSVHARSLYDQHKRYLASEAEDLRERAAERESIPGKRELLASLPAKVFDGIRDYEIPKNLHKESNWTTEGANSAKRMRLHATLKDECGIDVKRVFFPGTSEVPKELFIVAFENISINDVFITPEAAYKACRPSPSELDVITARVLKPGEAVVEDEYAVFNWPAT